VKPFLVSKNLLARRWAQALGSDQMHICVQHASSFDGTLRFYLARFVVVASSSDLSKKWAEVMVSARRQGRRMKTADAWIAATALLYEAVLLTENTADYGGVQNLRLTNMIGRKPLNTNKIASPSLFNFTTSDLNIDYKRTLYLLQP
jgi:hypothetical protein